MFKKALSTVAAAALVTLIAFAFGAGVPRARHSGAKARVRHSPSMSRAKPHRSPKKQHVKKRPKKRPSPKRPSGSRPGVATRPSGRKRPDGKRTRDFVRAPGTRAQGGRTSVAVKPRRPSAARTGTFSRAYVRPRHPVHARPPLPRRYPPHHVWHRPYGPRYPYHWRHWRRWGTAAYVNRWVRYDWDDRYYYDYGDDGNVCYRDDAVYVNDKRYASTDEYYEQAKAIASAAPRMSEAQAAKVEWLPLGVFAYSKKSVSDTHMYLQLAVSKEGIIGGTFFNDATNTSRPLEGTVEEKTQRAAWMFADGKNTEIIMETVSYTHLRAHET